VEIENKEETAERSISFEVIYAEENLCSPRGDDAYIEAPHRRWSVANGDQRIARIRVNRTARIQHNKRPKDEEEEIKIEVNVVYQQRSIGVSEKSKSMSDIDASCGQEIEISLHRFEDFRANKKEVVRH
jgi:hypothetical protein